MKVLERSSSVVVAYHGGRAGASKILCALTGQTIASLR